MGGGVTSPRGPASLCEVLAGERPRQTRGLTRRLPAGVDAEDVWQDAAVKALHNAETLTQVRSPTAWMTVVLRRLVVDRYRRAARERRAADALAAEPPAVPDDTPDLVLPIACMTGALGDLKPEYGEILAQTYLRDQAVRAVAERLGVTANNAGVRLHRARGALRAALAAKCQACPLEDCWAKSRVKGLGDGGE
jgi:RNA polymerase sigma-70 factor (ECF subfamily)